MSGESPIRPGYLKKVPPVEVPAATFPRTSSATAPTVPNFSSFDGCALSGLHSLRSLFDGCALSGLHSLRSLFDGCALSGLHSLRSLFDGCALSGLHSLRSLFDGCALSGLHSLRSLKRDLEFAGAAAQP